MVRYRELIASIYEGKVSGQKLPDSFYQAARNSEVLEKQGDPRAGGERARAIHIARQHGYNVDSLEEIPRVDGPELPAHTLSREHSIDPDTLRNVPAQGRYPTAPNSKPSVTNAYDGIAERADEQRAAGVTTTVRKEAYDAIDQADKQRDHRKPEIPENPLDSVFDKVAEGGEQAETRRNLQYIAEKVKELVSGSESARRLFVDYGKELQEARGTLAGIKKNCGIISNKLSQGIEPKLDEFSGYVLDLQKRVEGVIKGQRGIVEDLQSLVGNVRTAISGPANYSVEFDQDRIESLFVGELENLRKEIGGKILEKGVLQEVGKQIAAWAISYMDIARQKSGREEGGTRSGGVSSHDMGFLKELTRTMARIAPMEEWKPEDMSGSQDPVVRYLISIQKGLKKARKADRENSTKIYKAVFKKFEALGTAVKKAKDNLITEKQIRAILQEEVKIPTGITTEEVGHVISGYAEGLQAHLNDLQRRIPEDYRERFAILCDTVEEIRATASEGLATLPKTEYFDEKFEELATKAEINSSITVLSDKLDQTAKTTEVTEVKEAVTRAQSTLDKINNGLERKLTTERAEELVRELTTAIDGIDVRPAVNVTTKEVNLSGVYRRLDVIDESLRTDVDLSEVYSRLDRLSNAISSIEGLDTNVSETLRENLNEEKIRGYVSSALEGRENLTEDNIREVVTEVLDKVKGDILVGVTDKTDYGRVERMLDRVLETKVGSFRSVIEEEMRGKSVQIDAETVGEALENYFSGIDSRLETLEGRKYPDKGEIADEVVSRLGRRTSESGDASYPTKDEIADAVAEKIGSADKEYPTPEAIADAIDAKVFYPTLDEIAEKIKGEILSGVEGRLKNLEEREVLTAGSIAAEVVRQLDETSGLDPETVGKAIDDAVGRHLGVVHTELGEIKTAVTTKRTRSSKPRTAPKPRTENPEHIKSGRYDRLPQLSPDKEAQVLTRILANNKKLAEKIIPGSHDLGSFEETMLTDTKERRRVASKAIEELGYDNVRMDYEDV